MVHSRSILKELSVRHKIARSVNRFEVKTLPKDLLRVYNNLARKFGEDYALIFVFTVRTGSELHRAWHMTLLTSQILQQIKDKFNMRMTWELGVLKLKFRVEDGGYELHRKVPYDYDSEFQDLYSKIAIALIEDRIDIHQALNFQSDTKHGKNTAKSGLFLRDFPGRLVLYPLEAATCAVIFFEGDLYDGLIAAVCGFTAGLIEYFLCTIGGDAKILIDVLVGFSTGVIGGLFYDHTSRGVCLPAVFMGTLYWFFYGTAFVIGILEIASGELETGVVRFMGVSVKTFVLTLGTTIGMKAVLEDSQVAWHDDSSCNHMELQKDIWHSWNIPLYLLCSASALGQYRFPIIHYWRGLTIQLVGYVVQKAVTEWVDADGNMETAISNVLAAMASVVAACTLSYIVERCGYYYNARLLQRDNNFSAFGEVMYTFSEWYVRVTNCIKLGRKSDLMFLNMKKKIDKQSEEMQNAGHARTEITLEKEEERVLTQAIINAEPLNVWALLMPTVYQLVPGSLIAKFWFNSVLPQQEDELEQDVFAGLMVTATSLALGLLLGMGVVTTLTSIFEFLYKKTCGVASQTETHRSRMVRHKGRMALMNFNDEDDPALDVDIDVDNADFSNGMSGMLRPNMRLSHVSEGQEDDDLDVAFVSDKMMGKNSIGNRLPSDLSLDNVDDDTDAVSNERMGLHSTTYSLPTSTYVSSSGLSSTPAYNVPSDLSLDRVDDDTDATAESNERMGLHSSSYSPPTSTHVSSSGFSSTPAYNMTGDITNL